jgi:zinc protease
MRLREKDGLSYGTWAWTEANWADEAGAFGAGAIVAPANLGKAKAAMLEEINKIATGKVPPEELRRARDSWIKWEDTALSNDNYVIGLLRNQLHRGRTMAWNKGLRAKVEALTPAEIERVAKTHLVPSKLVIIDAGDVSKQK